MTDTAFTKLIAYLVQRFDKSREETQQTVFEAIHQSENRLNDRFDEVMTAIEGIGANQVADNSLKLGYQA
ncbi:MAG: hypothetical protein WBB39_00500 [Candidatus Saccharimonadales bacterium]